MGVHRARLRSRSFLLVPPSRFVDRSKVSVLLDAAVPTVVRSSNLRAAGVRFPGSLRRGVHTGGAIVPLFASGVTLAGPSRLALERRLFAALLESLWEIISRDVIAGIWNGVLGGGRAESDCDITLGVALRVPHVINCLTAVGPRSEVVGEGMLGRSEKLFDFGDRGR